jgi:hypothetical protein
MIKYRKAWFKLIKDSSYPFTKAEIQEIEQEQLP